MSELNSKEYYRNRQRQERKLADEAADPAVAAIHRDMAERYGELGILANGNEAQHMPRLKLSM